MPQPLDVYLLQTSPFKVHHNFMTSQDLNRPTSLRLEVSSFMIPKGVSRSVKILNQAKPVPSHELVLLKVPYVVQYVTMLLVVGDSNEWWQNSDWASEQSQFHKSEYHHQLFTTIHSVSWRRLPWHPRPLQLSNVRLCTMRQGWGLYVVVSYRCCRGPPPSLRASCSPAPPQTQSFPSYKCHKPYRVV